MVPALLLMQLLDKLLAVDRAMTRGDYRAVRALLVEAQDCVLQLERELLNTSQALATTQKTSPREG
jgi:hypothetical protein